MLAIFVPGLISKMVLDIHWKEVASTAWLRVTILALLIVPTIVFAGPGWEMQDSTIEPGTQTPPLIVAATATSNNRRTYDLCGNTTKCICVDTEVRKTIQCEGGRLRGQLPTNIAVPPDYTSIDFSRDSIPFIGGDTFDGTYLSMSVVKLDFSNNDIERIDDGTFGMFEALRELVLRRNKIANLTLGVFRNLRYLESLDLSYNNIASVEIDVLYPCTALRRLSVRFNPLTLQGLQDLLSSASTNLEELDLHGLNLDQMPDDMFRPVPYVQKIVLSGNRLTEVPGEALSRMRRLAVLDLSDNFISQVKDIDFQGLESLEELHLNRMRNLQQIGQGSFASLRNLKIFSASFNARLYRIEVGAFPDAALHRENYGGDEDEEIDPMPDIDGRDWTSMRPWHLEEIHLRQNALTTVSESLLPWDKIRYVDLSENPWKCDCRLLWMKQIDWDMKRVPPIRCEMPISARRRLMADVSERDFRCETSLETHLTISVALLLATMCFLLTAFCLFAFVHKPTCFNACRAAFQRRYSKLNNQTSAANGDRRKSNNNLCRDATQDLEMCAPRMNGGGGGGAAANDVVVTTAIIK